MKIEETPSEIIISFSKAGQKATFEKMLPFVQQQSESIYQTMKGLEMLDGDDGPYGAEQLLEDLEKMRSLAKEMEENLEFKPSNSFNMNPEDYPEAEGDKFSIRFIEAFEDLLRVEGGYSNDPNDKGGETYAGIARNYHPDWEGWTLIDMMKDNLQDWKEKLNGRLDEGSDLKKAVKRFYKKRFWDPLHLDIDVAFPTKDIAATMFETAVHFGTKRGVEHLQNSLNKMNRDGKDFDDLKVDGVMGPKTKGALKAYWSTSKFSTRSLDRNAEVLKFAIHGHIFCDYLDAIKRNPDQEKFLYGWIRGRLLE